MEEKYCLKFDYDLLRVQAIIALLQEQGIQAERCGYAYSNDRKYESRVVIDHDAFYRVCDMLSRTRQELHETKQVLAEAQKKPRRLFGRR